MAAPARCHEPCIGRGVEESPTEGSSERTECEDEHHQRGQRVKQQRGPADASRPRAAGARQGRGQKQPDRGRNRLVGAGSWTAKRRPPDSRQPSPEPRSDCDQRTTTVSSREKRASPVSRVRPDDDARCQQSPGSASRPRHARHPPTIARTRIDAVGAARPSARGASVQCGWGATRTATTPRSR